MNILFFKLQQDICDINDIFKDLAGMVEEQGEDIGKMMHMSLSAHLFVLVLTSSNHLKHFLHVFCIDYYLFLSYLL